MPQSPKFNYIITIHNKEDMIEQVMMCVLMCCRDNSHIYPVLDGCTDKTEEIIDKIINTYSDVPITKVYTPDVHELLSINAGLKAASQEGEGYNIVLQDDVLLADFMLEKKVIDLYKWAGPSLGYVSFRLGANFTPDAATSNEIIPLSDYVENAYGHGLPNAKVLLPGHFTYRDVSIKSPVCIPFNLIRSVGMLNDRLAPYGHDDTDYSIRCIKAGFHNAVFMIRFYSDVKWGGTRIRPDSRMGGILTKNIKLIRGLYSSEIMNISKNGVSADIVEVPNMVNEDDIKLALEVWDKNLQQLRNRNENKKQNQTINRIMSNIRRVLRLNAPTK